MPTYLWRCSTCRKETETFKSIKNRDESPEEKFYEILRERGIEL
jgi:predicted nucleic acid-binding Zn ribbon protein